jgi:hypothetical protein
MGFIASSIIFLCHQQSFPDFFMKILEQACPAQIGINDFLILEIGYQFTRI